MIVLWFFLLVPAVLSADPNVKLIGSKTFEVDPGSRHALKVWVQSPTATEITLQSIAPKGWSMGLPEKRTLSAHIPHIEMGYFRVPKGAQAGSYQLVLDVQDTTGTKKIMIPVTVKKQRSIHLSEANDFPFLDGTEEKELQFRLRNSGNTQENIAVRLLRPEAALYIPEPRITLAPGEEKQWSVLFRPTAEVNRAEKLIAFLVFEGDDTEELLRKTIEYRVIGNSGTDTNVLPLPVKIRTKVDTDGTAHQAQVHISGSGVYNQETQSKISYEMTLPTIQNKVMSEKGIPVTLNYSDPTYEWFFGIQGYKSHCTVIDPGLSGIGLGTSRTYTNYKWSTYFVRAWDSKKGLVRGEQHQLGAGLTTQYTPYLKQSVDLVYRGGDGKTPSHWWTVGQSIDWRSQCAGDFTFMLGYHPSFQQGIRTPGRKYNLTWNYRDGASRTYQIGHAYTSSHYIHGGAGTQSWRAMHATKLGPVSLSMAATRTLSDRHLQKENRKLPRVTGSLTSAYTPWKGFSMNYGVNLLCEAAGWPWRGYAMAKIDQKASMSGSLFGWLWNYGANVGFISDHVKKAKKFPVAGHTLKLNTTLSPVQTLALSGSAGSSSTSLTPSNVKDVSVRHGYSMGKIGSMQQEWKYRWQGKSRAWTLANQLAWAVASNKKLALSTEWTQYPRSTRPTDFKLNSQLDCDLALPGFVWNNGEIFGRIMPPQERFDEGQRPIFRVGKRKVIADVSGFYKIRGLEEGKHILNLVHKPFGFLTKQRFPQAVTLKKGEKVRRNYVLVEECSVRGTVLQYKFGAAVQGARGKEDWDPNSRPLEVDSPVADAVIMLTYSDGESLVATSDSNGHFSFTSLRPGPWEMEVVKVELPPDYVLANPKMAVTLAPAEQKQVTIRLEPKKRKIKFVN